MGRYSYSQPSLCETRLASSSHDEFDFVCKPTIQSGRSGIPPYCCCGLAPVTHTSTTDLNPGRVFYGCKNHKDGGHHLFKWWDEALIEEIQELRFAVEKHEEHLHTISKEDFDDPMNVDRLVLMRLEITDLKEEMLGKYGGPNYWKKAFLFVVAWKDVVVALIILGLISCLLFKK